MHPCVGLSVIQRAQFSVMLSDAVRHGRTVLRVCVCVCVLPLWVIQVFVWIIQVPALAFLSTFCVVHWPSVIFPITVHTLDCAAATHTRTHTHTHTDTPNESLEEHGINLSKISVLSSPNQWLIFLLQEDS